MKLLVATLFLSGVFSAPLNSLLSVPPSTECDKGFHPKKTLLYEYEGETISGIVGNSGERSGLKLRITCKIIPVKPCVHKLKITGAELLESQSKNPRTLVYETSSGSSNLRQELTARELYFESKNGEITDLRPEDGEPTHILNMKRGILSAFHLKLIKDDETVTEVDVAGECRAKYHVTSRHPDGTAKTLVKTKNLTECKDRSMTNLGFPTTSYPTEKPFSLLNSKSSCSFHVSAKYRVGQVQCKETHLFRPFSSGYNKSAGAMTTVRQTLKLASHQVTEPQSTSLPATEKLSLKYEHSRKEEAVTKNDKEVRAILDKLVSDSGVKPDSAKLFSKLIFAIRRLNMKALHSIWYTYYDCLERQRCTKMGSEKYQTYIVDALSQCGTLECAQYMVNMISEKKVGTQQSIAFLTGIALVGRPSEDMVGNILYFCQENPSRTAFLTLGTIMHKFCSQHDCSKLHIRSSINQADIFLRRKLENGCQASTPEEISSITLALKAVGNAGRPFSAVKYILKCAVQPGSTPINIEALQALRRISCTTNITDGLLDIFKNLLTDTEIRIETYLALMRCPNHKVINDIADVLDKEKNNQVGSFVWSHMTNALESTEPVYGVPLRNMISKALGARKLRKFNRNHLRFSHAYESSYYNKKQEVGGSSQAQLIFHPNSYFPRSAKFNLTVDVFGASINLLETAARFEGFESLIEQMFGAEGYFPDERIMKLLKQNDKDHRSSRSTNEGETNEIKRNLEELHDKIKIEKKNPSGGLSFKVFGHELQFISFEDIDWLQGEADSINVIDALISLARGGQMTYVKSFMFLDADHEIPTGIGLPLKLAVNGSAVSSLNLKGKFDIRNMFWGKKKLDIRGIVSPSTVIDISGKMSVDAKHASSGIHMNTSLYTATEINGNATFKEGEGIKLSIEPPKKPVHIVNFTSNLATYLNKKPQRISGSLKRFERQTCANFSKVLGINLCGHVSLPIAFRDYNAPYYPLSGDSSFGLVYQTTNAELARFELEGRTLTSKDDNRYDWIFNMHIPGLTFGRSIEANSTFHFLKEGKYLSVSCGIHDYKFGKFEAMYNNVTNGLHTKFSTPELSYLKPIVIESEVFNKTNPVTQQTNIGIVVNATYNNFTIQEVVTLFKQNDQYGFKSNMTYWPRKHFTTEGRISLLRKSAYLKMHDTNSKTNLLWLGKSGSVEKKFYLRLGNDILNHEVKLDGAVNLEQKTFMVDMFTKPSRSLFKFEGYPRKSATESGFFVSLLHVNSSSKFTGHLRASNTPTQRALKFSGMVRKKPFHVHVARYIYNNVKKVELFATGFGNSANASLGLVTKSGSVGVEYIAALNEKTMTSKLDLFKDPKKFGFNLHGSVVRQTFDVLGEYFRDDQNNGLHLRLAGANKTVDTTASYFVTNEERGVNFTIKGMDNRANLVAAYYKQEREAGIRLKGTVSDKSMEIAAGLFTLDNERGLKVRADVLDKEIETRLSILSGNKLKFVVNALKKNLQIETGLFYKNNVRGWRVDTLYNGIRTSLLSTYTNLPTEKTLCSEMANAEKIYFKVCSQYIHNTREKTVHLSAEVPGRKAEMTTSLVHTDSKKGGQLKLKYNDAVMFDVFIGKDTIPSYSGIRFTGSIKEKTFDAFLYTNGLKDSVDLQLRIQGRQVSFETHLIRKQEERGIQMNIAYQNKPAGSLFAILVTRKGSNSFRVGVKSSNNNGVEYRLSVTNSRLEKSISSITTVTVNKKHYKYGGAVSYSNQGVNGQTNHLVTTRLHYSRSKTLTSTFHLVNNDQHFHVLSKMELVPGQFLTNKFSFIKQSNKVSAHYEFLPGLGMTYEAVVTRENRLLKLTSTVTMLDYPMESLIIFDKQDQRLKMRITYCPVRPPIELTGYLRTVGGVDMGLVLSAFKKTWSNTFSMDYSLKKLDMSLNVLPDVPIHILGNIGNDQIVLNITTCSTFSFQMTGRKLAKDDYQLILRHKYLENVFEDLRLSVNSLRDLRKLSIKLDAKSATEILRSMNVSMERLLNSTHKSLMSLSEKATELTRDIVNYIRSDGRKLLRKLLENYKERLNTIKKQLKALQMNDLIDALPSHVIEMYKDVKKSLKNYGTRLVEIYKRLEKIVNDVASELLPHLRTLTTDTRLWLSRSIDRYRSLSIFGRTLNEIASKVSRQAREFLVMFNEKWQEQSKRLSMKIKDFEVVIRKFKELSEEAKTKMEEFTCNYDMDCTMTNVKTYLTKLENREELVKLRERLEKLREGLLEQYRTLKKHISTTINDKKLREKASRVIKPIVDFIKTVRAAIDKQIRPLQEKIQEIVHKVEFYGNELAIRYKDAVHRMNSSMVKGKKDLRLRFQELKQYLETIRIKAMEIYEKVKTNIHEFKKMSLIDMQNLLENKVVINYGRLRKALDSLLEKAKITFSDFQRQHVVEIERVMTIGRKIYSISIDAINGRLTLKELQVWLEKFAKELHAKIQTLHLTESAEKFRTKIVYLFEERIRDLKGQIRSLYPKVISELKRLVEKVRRIVNGYVDHAKLKISELSKEQKLRLDAAIVKIKELKAAIMEKIKEFMDQYKKLNMDSVEQIMDKGKKVVKNYGIMVKEAVYKYKTKVIISASEQYKKTRQDILDLITLYKDMPIERIIEDLRKKTGIEVEKVMGFVIGKSLSAYETVETVIKKINKMYGDGMKVLLARWDMISNDVREVYTKYRAMADKKYQEISRHINENCNMEDIQKITDQAKSFLETRYQQMMLSYEKVKHMKFKEFYTKVKELLQKWANELKNYREMGKNKVDEWKTKMEDLIKETVIESTKVATRVNRINEEIKHDAITTFRPYKVRLEDVFRKHIDNVSGKAFHELRPIYERLRQLVSELKKTAEFKTTSFNRIEIMENILQALTKVKESLYRCPFIDQVRMHKLWPALKQEFFNHEIMEALKELRTSMTELQSLSNDYYANLMVTFDRLKDQLNTKVSDFKRNLSVQGKLMKKQLQEKREELELKFRHARGQIKEVVEKRLNDAGNMYNAELESFITRIEYIGEMSLYDVQLRATNFFKKNLKAVKDAYSDVSEYLHKQLDALGEKRKAILHRVDRLREKAEVLLVSTKEWYNAVRSSTNKWTRLALDASISQAVKIEQLITKAIDDLKELVREYPSYNDLLKMTPNDILKHLKEIPYGQQFEALKMKLKTNLNTSFSKAKLYAKMGFELTQELLKDSEKLIKFVVSEILETVVFINKFYGMETVYSRRPELTVFAENQYRVLCNRSSAWALGVVRYFNKTSEMLVELTRKFPDMLEYAKTEIKQMDIKSLEKLKKFVTDYIKKYYPALLESMIKVNMEAKMAYETSLKSLNQIKERYLEKYREIFERLKEKYRSIVMFINTDLTMSLKDAREKVTMALKTIEKDLTTLVGKISENLQRTARTIHTRVTRQFSSYENDIQLMKNILHEVKGKVRSITLAIKKTNVHHLPAMKQRVNDVMEAIRVMNISLTNRYVMMSPVIDAFIELLKCGKEALNAQYDDTVMLVDKMISSVRPNLLILYNNNLHKVKTVFELCSDDLNKSWLTIRKELENFYKLKKTSILESTKLIRETLREYWNDMERMRKENMEKCVTTVKIYYKKGEQVLDKVRNVNVREVVTRCSKNMSEKGGRLINDVKERVRLMVEKLKAEIQRMRKRVIAMNEEIMRTVKDGKMRVENWIDVDDLMNKTIEIKEDLYKLNVVEELVDFGKRFYTEYRKIVELTKENTEFAVYIVKHVFRYNDLWEIISELTSPFHWLPPSNSIAMIFGRSHVYTFDGQYYKFVGYKKPDCTYVLAKDIRDDSFTLMSQETSLIIITKTGSIKVDASGKVETTVLHGNDGKKVNIVYDELPVEMKNANVTRDGDFVKINHDIGLKVVCDLKHFYCTFNVDKFYHGRLAGLLGTNNNEQYDRLMKPDKTIAKSEIEFANAWEVSGDAECKVQDLTEVQTPCKKNPSPRCNELFLQSSSPLAKYFKYLDPTPFYKACLFDTSDCKTESPKTRNFCNVTAAYTALLREKGVWVRQIPECLSCGSKSLWNQKANKNVDVVLLIPETSDMDAHAIDLPGILRELDGDLRVKYKPRYAIVGFGGKTAVHQVPHIVTGDSKIFGDIDNAIKAIGHMSFTNEKADALDTIDFIAGMPFSAGATKIVMLLTGQHRNATSSKNVATAIKELKTQGIIFNVIGPYFQKKHEVFGVWKGKSYREHKQRRHHKSNFLSLSFDDYVKLAQSTQGGIFNLKAISPGESAHSLKKTMKTTLIEQITIDQEYCRTCVCLGSLASKPEFMCTVNRHRRCS